MVKKINKKKYLQFAIDYFQDEDGVYTAVIPAIKGCVASGKTLREAYQNAIDAVDSCLEAREIIGEKLNTNRKYESVNIYRKELMYA